MTGWYDDGRMTYPEADELVGQYIDANARRRTQTTSVDVLNWAGRDLSNHNKSRVYDALTRVAEPTDANWAGRTVFKIPTDTTEP